MHLSEYLDFLEYLTLEHWSASEWLITNRKNKTNNENLAWRRSFVHTNHLIDTSTAATRQKMLWQSCSHWHRLYHKASVVEFFSIFVILFVRYCVYVIIRNGSIFPIKGWQWIPVWNGWKLMLAHGILSKRLSHIECGKRDAGCVCIQKKMLQSKNNHRGTHTFDRLNEWERYTAQMNGMNEWCRYTANRIYERARNEKKRRSVVKLHVAACSGINRTKKRNRKRMSKHNRAYRTEWW